MKWSYSIGRVSGIDVRLHVTFLLLLGYLGWQGYQAGGTDLAVMNVAFVTLLFLCVLLHEFGHAFAARNYGIRTPDITLYPIGGVARLERMPENPMQELVIAVAGPAVNVVIAILLWFGLGLPTRFGDSLMPTGTGSDLAARLMQVNIMLVAFNLIPAFPMDGGRMLRALLAFWIDHTKATRIAARVGQVIAVIFAIVGLSGIPGYVDPNPVLIFIALFVFMGAQQESTFAGMRAAVAEMRIADAMTTQFRTLPSEMRLEQAAREAMQDTQPVYPVTDPQLRLAGMVTRNALLKGSLAGDVGLLAEAIPAVQSDATFDEAFRLMQQSGSAVLPVVNPSGQLIGLVSLNLLSQRARARKA